MCQVVEKNDMQPILGAVLENEQIRNNSYRRLAQQQHLARQAMQECKAFVMLNCSGFN